MRKKLIIFFLLCIALTSVFLFLHSLSIYTNAFDEPEMGLNVQVVTHKKVETNTPTSSKQSLTSTPNFSEQDTKQQIYTKENIVGLNNSYDDTVWPTDPKRISSTYGPRQKYSEGSRYDFHRGIDIPGREGVDPVYAIADGEIFRTYNEGDPLYVSGGNTVVLRHKADQPILHHGIHNTTYYSSYMHLDSIVVEKASDGGPYAQIKKGQLIGFIGKTGTTEFNHLHFEIRVGTHCSREYQERNPASSCARVFKQPTDPNINPLMILPYAEVGGISVNVIEGNPVKVAVSVPRTHLVLNSFSFYNGRDKKVINYNEQTGIHPSIDVPTFNDVTIVPSRFTSESEKYEVVFILHNWDKVDKIEVLDVFGSGVRFIRKN